MPTIDRARDDLRELAVHIERARADLGTGSFDPEEAVDPAHGGTLDPIPLTIGGADWTVVGRALEQRAMVLEQILDDLFGPQRLLAGGHLPTEAILAHREYLRQCVGISSPGRHRLVLYAADIARSPGGSFSVLADRTQMPSGIGSAVQNREVMARVNPEALQDHAVRPVEDWLSACRTALGGLAPTDVEQPRIVMMTPGSSAATHAEHAYLARSLGFTLVEPGDLTVRDAHVWLKSVAGLEPVHVIVRLVPSPDCDPLELCTDSVLGVAGLVEACRRDNVAVANPIGSGVGECAALLPFMPRLTRTLLGEDPLIDSAPTWWCGDPAGRSHVLANLDRLLIRSHEATAGRHTRFGRTLGAAELDELAREIRARPHLFVGQEEVDIAMAPGSTGDAVADRPTVTRAFLVREPQGYRCMDGGLTLTADVNETITFSSYRTSKDTWVTDHVGTAEHRPAQLRTEPKLLRPIDLRDSITSRAAESMYWIGRNLERSHAVIRVVRAAELLNETRHDLRDLGDDRWAATVDRLVNTVAGYGVHPPDAPAPSTAELLTAALVDRTRSRSLATSLHYLLQNAASVRELFSTDSWRQLSQISNHHLRLGMADPENAAEIAYWSVTPLVALSGLVNDSMVRDPGWRFLDIGRRLEGASLVAMTVAAALVDDPPALVAPAFLELVLNGWDGLGAYRRRYRSDIVPELLIDLLVTDESNPRSVVAQLALLSVDLHDIPGPADRNAEVIGAIAGLMDIVSSAGADRLAEVVDGRRPALRIFTDAVRSTLDAVATEIDLTYFVQVRSTSMFSELETPLIGAEDHHDGTAP